ncbi:MAG TPA: flagellar biosynthetic protein FliQ [Bryobacteraceae bacterium]|nr:flagellar biosynthetic protein FliQ [Bryobacteraceae bacterium]
MTPEFVVETIRQTLILTFWVGAPLLLIGFAAGIVVSLIQIVTSIQDTGFSTMPRLMAFLFGTVLLMPWMLKKMTTYTVLILSDLGKYAR